MTLLKIKEFAVANKACYSQLNKFNEFITIGDELSAWQTVFGNYAWLSNKGFVMKQSEVEKLANGIGKTWYNNGKICIEFTYKNGKRDGLYRLWHENGQLFEEFTYKEGKKDGLYRRWHPSGLLLAEVTYKNDVLDL